MKEEKYGSDFTGLGCPKCNYNMQKRKLLYENWKEDGTGEEWKCCDNWCNYRADKEQNEKLDKHFNP